ncbi:MAG TPA: hypothetical protein VF601_09165 [Beijerinckiaceae bacterium]|jgi:hypothetical protein
MPLQNRVTPFGELVADAGRGLLFGNRGGRFHDPATRRLRTRRWASKQWIVCLLAFKGRHREVWKTGYTELFFLDEVTALAAGHRPCCECRRAAARGFHAAVVAAGEPPSSLDEIDARLHCERLDGRGKRLHRRIAERLPDGAMITLGDKAFAVRGDAILPWSPAGYGAPRPRPSGMVEVLTPPLALAALAGGYAPCGIRPQSPIPASAAPQIRLK